MVKLHTFSKDFCNNILNSIDDKNKIILQYGYSDINNEENRRVINNQPIDSDAWTIDYQSEYIIEIVRILNTHIDNLYKHKTGIQRFDSEKKCKPHRDASNYTSILLLNDDFIGGDLIVENTKTNLKVGELLVFDSNDLHYVEKVISGQRYTLVSFIDTRDIKEKTII